MFGIGAGELLLILMLALFVLGPERMPKLARDIGRTVGDLRRTSDELKQEFLNADALIEKAASLPSPASAVDVGAVPPAEGTPAPIEPGAAADGAAASSTDTETQVPDAGLTQAAVIEPEPDETAFDRDARLARERLEDPARVEQAKAEGWKPPTDEAGTNSDRWG